MLYYYNVNDFTNCQIVGKSGECDVVHTLTGNPVTD